MTLLQCNSNSTESFWTLDTPDRMNVQVWMSRVDDTSETLEVEFTSVTAERFAG
ncbi:hypothetical protein [Mycobacterium syngnathidarum]